MKPDRTQGTLQSSAQFSEQSSAKNAVSSARVVDPFAGVSLARVFNDVKSPELHEEFDVCVIGSGPGGATAARVAAEQGLRTILVEEGEFLRAHEFSQRESDATALYQERMMRRTVDGGVTILQGRTVGGSSTVNWTSSFRTPPQTLDWWASGFDVKGLSFKGLDPVFTEVEQLLNVAEWRIPNPNNERLAQGCENLGWSWGHIHRNVKGCWNIGYCGLGCPTNAKRSALTACIPEFLRAGGYLLPKGTALRLEWSGQRVTALHVQVQSKPKGVAGASGLSSSSSSSSSSMPSAPTALVLRAKKFVVSGGAVGTPALLLRSQVPDPHGLIGKRTFLHPVVTSFAKFESPIEPFSGAPQSTYSDQFLWPSDEANVPGFKIESMPLLPMFAAGLSVFSGENYRTTLGHLTHVQATMALQRDGFHEDSLGGRVTLDDQGRPLIAYEPSEYQFRGFQRAMLAVTEIQFAAGARAAIPVHLEGKLVSSWREAKAEIEQLPMRLHSVRLGSAHDMGGCPMSEDPKRGVVNSMGRSHHLENLMVCDGSVFPSSLGVNPQISIFAIALTFARAWFVN